jgi:hypothetical protein
MDIQILSGAHEENQYIDLIRTYDGHPNKHRYPKEILAIRAAEYNLEWDDPRVLDMVLLEHLIPDPEERFHPLYLMDPHEAIEVVSNRIEVVKQQHDAPEGDAGKLLLAADTDAATLGLKKTKKEMFQRAPRDIDWIIRHHRDSTRKVVDKIMAQGDSDPLRQVRDTALAELHAEAAVMMSAELGKRV